MSTGNTWAEQDWVYEWAKRHGIERNVPAFLELSQKLTELRPSPPPPSLREVVDGVARRINLRHSNRDWDARRSPNEVVAEDILTALAPFVQELATLRARLAAVTLAREAERGKYESACANLDGAARQIEHLEQQLATRTERTQGGGKEDVRDQLTRERFEAEGRENGEPGPLL